MIAKRSGRTAEFVVGVDVMGGASRLGTGFWYLCVLPLNPLVPICPRKLRPLPRVGVGRFWLWYGGADV